MKKNTMMRLASALLVAVLLTTCVIAGTAAKYTTSDNSTDSARVAKFGVEITANGETFANAYLNDVATDGADVEVKGALDAKVIAPGTEGEFASMTLTGTPEVDVTVTYVATVTLTDWFIDTDVYYCPIKVTVNTTELNGNDYDSAAEFAAAIKTAIDGYSKSYNALTDLSTVGGDSLAISWEWAITGGVEQTDVNDTKIGDIGTDTITIAVATTVTQDDADNGAA